MSKKFICFVSLVLILGLASSASASLIANLKFDGNLTDSAGNNDGTYRKGTASYGTGVFGNAVGLDGIDDYIDLANESNFDCTGSQTIALWFRSSQEDHNWGDIASKGGTTSPTEPWQITGKGSENRIQGSLKDTTGNYVGRTYSTSDITAWDGEWHHVVLRYDQAASYVQMYFDLDDYSWAPHAYDSDHPFVTLNDDPVLIGEKFLAGDEDYANLDGDVDDFGFWDHALDMQHILYINKYGIPEPATIALLGLGGLLLIRRKRR